MKKLGVRKYEERKEERKENTNRELWPRENEKE